MINTFELENGLRIIHSKSPTKVAYCGIAIDAGTRDEHKNEYGLAHFCEHMMFKGTKKRKSWHILNRMESVGGDLNAYTNKEETVVYSAFMNQHLERATELITDIVFNSTFPQHELEKESEVIIEEIESYNDNPSELIFDEFENMIFENHHLGHDILGNSERIRNYKSENLKSFVSRLYKPCNMVYFVFGNYDFEYVKKTVKKYVSLHYYNSENKESNHRKRAKERVEYVVKNKTINKETHQAHVMIGCRAYSSDDKRRVALYFLNNIIGGPGMNSQLNVALREHNGLVYTVESMLTNYTDSSMFSIYFGCDSKDVEKCLRIVKKELKALMTTPISKTKYEAYMRQIKGQIGVACDNFENYALDMAKSYLHYNKFDGIEETFRLLDELSPKILQEVANDLFSEDNLSVLIYN
mgnify:CR=1 FL=1